MSYSLTIDKEYLIQVISDFTQEEEWDEVLVDTQAEMLMEEICDDVGNASIYAFIEARAKDFLKRDRMSCEGKTRLATADVPSLES